MFPYAVKEIRTRTALSPSSMKELKYAVNPYSGCTHSCLYCYAMDMTPLRPGDREWGKTVYVKRNFIDILKMEVKRSKRGLVGMSTITDPYQPVETKYRLARETLRVLLTHGFRVSVQTKSSLVLRDFDLISEHTNISDVGTTITTMDGKLSRKIEPLTPGPRARMKIVETASKENIRRWIFYGPIIRGFNDEEENNASIIELAESTGTRIIIDRYNSYTTPDIMLEKNGIKVKDVEYNRWWRKFSKEFRDACSKRNVMCNLESEEWFFQNLDITRTLF
ncbi:radical SAM protein [Oxyplasma meridianum]|uniref:Radical SAM protein n=1 Tax=Oxyplasma meridianum TaxID=3073602 RepID=A0AAX4NGY3_9ARCH